MKSHWQFAERHPFVSNAMLMAFSVVFTILVIDLTAFYLLGLRRVGYGPERFFQYSSLLGWEHIPNSEGTWYAYKDGTRTHVRINSFGLPDSERNVEPDRPRIALIGDSTTEFWEVDEEFRGQYVLQNALENRAEVLNFGLRGAGTDQVYIRMRQQVIHFSPDIVIYTFCINDIGNNMVEDSKPYYALDPDNDQGISLRGYPIRREVPREDPWLLGLLEHSFVLRKLKHFVIGITPHLRTNQPLDDHFELRPFKRIYDAEDEKRMEVLRRIVGALAGYARGQGIRLLLVEGLYRPALDSEMRQQVVGAYGDQFDFDKVSANLASVSAEFGIEFLSLPRLARNRALDAKTLMHREDTMHLNREGVKFYADAVAERISKLGWLTEAAVSYAGAGR